MFLKLTFAFAMTLITLSANTKNIPRIEATDLNKLPIVWPDDLQPGRTLLIVGFQGKQQTNIDTWIVGLNLKSKAAPHWFEVPLINDPGKIGRWFIDNGMRRGIPNIENRSHIVTVYGNKTELMKSMGIAGEEKVHVLVLDQKGQILARVKGDYSEANSKEILKALNVPP
jgi:hypothetical protein